MRSRQSAIAERRLDPDRLTALQATPAPVRSALEALWNLDLAFADVVATTTEPALGAIRLAWWREQLENLDKTNARSEPRLLLAQQQLIKRGITGAELSILEDAWLPLLDSFPWGVAAVEGLKLRGRVLFGIGAELLDGEPKDAESAGALWSLVDGAKNCSDADSRASLCAAARAAIAEVPARLPQKIRPLTILGALAAYDLRPGGRLGRVGVAFAHRYLGSIPSN
jgi:phytoene synthase